MSAKLVPHKPVSRRDFMKVGCLTVAATSLTLCGLSVMAPDPVPVSLQASTYGEKTMNKRVLVAYASAMGSTGAVAATIGETLGASGYCVDVKPIQENLSIEGYQAVLLGSAVQHGNWLPEAVDYVKSNQWALNRVAVALFTVHIANLGKDETSHKNRLAYLDAVRPLLQPVDEIFFAGKFDRRSAALLLPGWAARLVPPLDFRNWKVIRAWAESTSALL